MYIFDIENKSSLKDVLVENLKISGVRCRIPKKNKENEKEKENIYPDHQIFQKPLHVLKKCSASRLDGSTLVIPEFLLDACEVIEKNIKIEGIFRKAGSTCKQKERKLELNQGKKVSCEYHVLDVCSLVKLFFRELPQPIIPYIYHDVFLKCLLLSTYEKELDALMLACLLIPEENLATLAYFMEFLLKVSWHADKNKMNVKNLAIILTPTLMPVDKRTGASNSLEMTRHFKVIEMLIENAERIGKVPDSIVESLVSISLKKIKKKRRSGSITRMFTSLKKMVGSRGPSSEWDDSPLSTPDSLSSLGKRKNADSNPKTNLSSKKKRLIDSTGILTPSRCRMHGYAPSLHSLHSPPKVKRKSISPDKQRLGDSSSNEREAAKVRPSRLNLVRRCTTKKQKLQSKLSSANSMGSLFSVETEKSSLERKLSMISWGQRKNSLSDLFLNKSEPKEEEESLEKSVDLSDSEFITIHKSEYEEIKNRVSALEEDLEKLNSVHSVQTVQTAYEKTLQESERLNDGCAEQLAKRLSRELKIRRSLENKIIRSPSARKIGSIRRRSSEPKSNLKRGRPNTVQTGLPSPRLRSFSNENVNSAKKNPVTRSLTLRGQEWKSGEIFFARENLPQKMGTPQGRPSIAEIRCQNAGMVLEKAKLFNSLNESDDKKSKIPRRQSVRLENLRRNEVDKNVRKSLTRTRSLNSDKVPTTPLFINESHEAVCTPKSIKNTGRRETPCIKKALLTKSPRHLAKTPLSQMRSTQRSRATPMKALIEPTGTPHIGMRRSPRILARPGIAPRLKE